MALPTSGKPMQFNERYFICYGVGIIAYADREAGDNANRAARADAAASAAAVVDIVEVGGVGQTRRTRIRPVPICFTFIVLTSLRFCP